MKSNLTKDQVTIAQFLSKRKRALVCEKAGKGKTFATLAAFIKLQSAGKAERLLVLAPRNAYDKGVWESECKRHTSLRVITVDKIKELVQGRPLTAVDKIIKNYDVVCGKHSHVKNTLELLMYLRGPKTIVCLDEAHAFKNPSCKQTMLTSCWVRGAYACWMLTATPVSKDLTDTYNIINLLRPGTLGSYQWFVENVCLTQEVRIKMRGVTRKVQKVSGIKNVTLLERLLKPVVVKGSATITPSFHKIEYNLSPKEVFVYKKIARGIEMSPDLSEEVWIKRVLSSEDSPSEDRIKAVDVHSSRFIYLQYAADGIVKEDGSIEGHGSKYDLILSQVKSIVEKKQSCIIYFDYYQALDTFKRMLESKIRDAKVLESSGRSVLQANDINENACKQKSHIILMTRAGAPSVSFYYINNIIMAHIPTVPEVFIQAVGRITRINTLYPDDLNVYVPLSENIDEYKLRLVTSKTEQMETVAGEENNIPDWFRGQSWDEKSVRTYKKYFLWV